MVWSLFIISHMGFLVDRKSPITSKVALPTTENIEFFKCEINRLFIRQWLGKRTIKRCRKSLQVWDFRLRVKNVVSVLILADVSLGFYKKLFWVIYESKQWQL